MSDSLKVTPPSYPTSLATPRAIGGTTPAAGTFTVAAATTRVETPTLGTDSTHQNTVPAVNGDTFALLAAMQELTNKTNTAQVVKAGLTASGSAANDFSGSTGTFLTSSGANTLSGDTTIAGSKTFTTGTGLSTISGDLLMAAGKIAGFGAPQALSGAGAVNVTTLVTLVTSTGVGDALTLADGTRAGQLKFVTMVVDGGSSVLTPTTKTNFTTLTLTALYDWGLMMWSGTAWRPVAFGGTAAFA